MRSVLLEVLDEPLALHALKKVLHVIQDELVQLQVDGRCNVDRHIGDWASFSSEGLLPMVEAMQLGLNGDRVTIYELELRLASFSKHLNHHLVEWLRIHRFEDLIFHMARRLP